MSSRDHVIHRSASEDRAARRCVDARARSGDDRALTRWIRTKVILLVLISALLATFLLLNRGSVVEPRVHLVFATYDRPSLLVVMLLTAVFSAAAALLVRAAFATARQLREVRARGAAAPPEPRPVGANERARAAAGVAS